MNIRVTMMALLAVTIFYSSCKSKKVVPPPPPEPVAAAPAPAPAPAPVVKDTDNDGIPDDKDACPEQKGTSANGCPEVVEQVFNYKNIQFEFNSSVLKTSSYEVLDEVARMMKTKPEAKFQLNGHSSAEGTEQRNMMLSVDRANAVKAYLVNNGIKSSNLITKGFGESSPLVANDTEAGRAKNRRVEIKPL
ncbi:OmpA family protein [Pedobacter puniceum]|jgi:OOP family OmpA-OmpF porin|uniref:OmpA family protein n=1 Tax=Pedobacter puniceum TaxID=2666136 RepID=A0A7K0FKA9_9SPHI|nr:OmpA family protein [Pedobacter puniceum]MRX45710.1 OmpA family protein [Pedobacter puniceum]